MVSDCVELMVRCIKCEFDVYTLMSFFHLMLQMLLSLA